MFGRAFQNAPSVSVARIAQNTSVGTAGAINLTATTSQPILVGEYVVVWVSNKGVNTWTALFGPTDANGLYTIPGQNGASGQLGAPNIQARSAGALAAHLIWAQRITTTQINSGVGFQVFINSGSGTLISVFRIRGASFLDNASALSGNNLLANNVYNLGAWRDTGNPVSNLAGYRRNIVLLQLITVGQANNILNGVGSNFSLVDNVTFGSGLSPSSQKYDLSFAPLNDPVTNSNYLGRWPLAVTNATITGMRFTP